MSLITLKTELRQELKLTPQLLQSMEMLRMNSQELLDYLNTVSEENPVIEQGDPASLRSAYAELRQKVSWLDGDAFAPTFTHEDTSQAEPGAMDRETESLCAFLCDQLERRHLSPKILAVAKYLSELVDEDGYLEQEDLDGLAQLHVPEGLIQEALEEVQRLEPPGVGARSLEECLLLQLQRSKSDSPARRIIEAGLLPELSRRHYGPISRQLGLTAEQIQQAEGEIAALEPRPGRAFQPEEPTIYVRPDLFVGQIDGKWQVILNEYYLPQISLSGYYTRLLRETEEKETRAYLRQKMRQAKWIMDSLERRGSTLRRCAEVILKVQMPFFSGKTGELAPMSLSSVASTLEVHPSTVSRAVQGKYLQCRQGTFPLRYFFSRSVNGQGPSRQAVKQRLAALLREEDPHHPLSDQELCRRLEEEGTVVARRTVAKYRTELGLGSSTTRRRR